MHFNSMLYFLLIIILPAVCWFEIISKLMAVMEFSATTIGNYAMSSPGMTVQVLSYKTDVIDTSLGSLEEALNGTIALMSNFTGEALDSIRRFSYQNARSIDAMDRIIHSEKETHNLSAQLKEQAIRLNHVLVISERLIEDLVLVEKDLDLVSDVIIAEEGQICRARAELSSLLGLVFSGGSVKRLRQTLNKQSGALGALMRWRNNTLSVVRLLETHLHAVVDNLKVIEGPYYDLIVRGYLSVSRFGKLQNTLALVEHSLECLATVLVSPERYDTS